MKTMANKPGWHLLPVPHRIEYTDNLPEIVGGRTTVLLVRIRPAFRTDEGLHRHEVAHAQVAFWACALAVATLLAMLLLVPAPLVFLLCLLSVWPFLVTRCGWFKFWNESRAYAIQTMHPMSNGVNLPIEAAAAMLADPKRYPFNITEQEALEAIKKRL